MFLTAHGNGTASLIGAFTFVAPHDFDLAAGTYVADAYVTDEHGELMHFATLGYFIDSVDSLGTWTLVGGTGRFADATGSGTLVNLNFGADITFDGVISIPDGAPDEP